MIYIGESKLVTIQAYIPDSIRKNLMDNHGEPVIYDFADFMYVLDVGLETDYFGALPQYDFGAVLTGIEFNF